MSERLSLSEYLKKEEETRVLLENITGCTFMHLGKFSKIDFVIFDGFTKKGYAELRCRYEKINTFDTTFLSEKKAMSLLKCTTETKVPVFYIVRYGDLLKYVRVETIDFSRKVSITRSEKHEREYSSNTDFGFMIKLDSMKDIKELPKEL